MDIKPKIGVVLTHEARQVFQDEAIRFFIKEGTYINCESVEQNGYFMDLKVSFSQTDLPNVDELKEHIAVLSIPSHFVLYLISGDANKALGFSTDL